LYSSVIARTDDFGAVGMASLHLPLSALVPRLRSARRACDLAIHFLDRPTPLILGRTMNSDGRSRRRELVEEAYNLQVKAGLMASRLPFRYYHHS
jgi:hypothetical protein